MRVGPVVKKVLIVHVVKHSLQLGRVHKMYCGRTSYFKRGEKPFLHSVWRYDEKELGFNERWCKDCINNPILQLNSVDL